MQDEFKHRAKADFDRARNRAFFRRLINSLFKKDNTLYQFDEVKYLLSPHGMSYRGVKSIPIEQIVGSEGRYLDFDKRFLPKQTHTRHRWENIDVARMDNMELPPINVYKIDDYYFVRDGNHRVSVAREKGQKFIDAEIVELYTRVPLDKDANFDGKLLLLNESKQYFLEKTKLDQIIPDYKIGITNPWGYYRLVEHINTFKELRQNSESCELKWEESVSRWYYDLYSWVVDQIRGSNMMRRFPERKEGDLYIWVMDHWHFLKEKFGDVDIKDALHDYSTKFGKSPIARFFERIGKWLSDKFTGSGTK